MKKRLLYITLCSMIFGLTACGETDVATVSEPQTQVIVTEIDTTPPAVGASDFDSQFAEASGRPVTSDEETITTDVVEETTKTYEFDPSRRCFSVQVEDILINYGIDVFDFKDLIDSSEKGLNVEINKDALISAQNNTDAVYTVTVYKNDTEWFTADFKYPKGTNDIVGVGSLVLTNITPCSDAGKETFIYGDHMSYSDIMAVTFNDYEDFLWKYVVPHDADFEILPTVVTDDGEIYTAKKEGVHYHTYTVEKKISLDDVYDLVDDDLLKSLGYTDPSDLTAVDIAELTEDEDLYKDLFDEGYSDVEIAIDKDNNVIYTAYYENIEEMCEYNGNKCIYCGYEIPELDYELKDEYDGITVTYTSSGDDLLCDNALWSGFKLYLPDSYTVKLWFSDEDRSLIKYEITMDSKVSWE